MTIMATRKNNYENDEQYKEKSERRANNGKEKVKKKRQAYVFSGAELA